MSEPIEYVHAFLVLLSLTLVGIIDNENLDNTITKFKKVWCTWSLGLSAMVFTKYSAGFFAMSLILIVIALALTFTMYFKQESTIAKYLIVSFAVTVTLHVVVVLFAAKGSIVIYVLAGLVPTSWVLLFLDRLPALRSKTTEFNFNQITRKFLF